MTKIYKDYEDYWRNGNHGCSSYSRDIVEATWKDLEATILANRGDYERLLVEESRHSYERFIKYFRLMHQYLDEFGLEEVAGVKFGKWMLGKALKEEDGKEET